MAALFVVTPFLASHAHPRKHTRSYSRAHLFAFAQVRLEVTVAPPERFDGRRISKLKEAMAAELATALRIPARGIEVREVREAPPGPAPPPPPPSASSPSGAGADAGTGVGVASAAPRVRGMANASAESSGSSSTGDGGRGGGAGGGGGGSCGGSGGSRPPGRGSIIASAAAAIGLRGNRASIGCGSDSEKKAAVGDGSARTADDGEGSKALEGSSSSTCSASAGKAVRAAATAGAAATSASAASSASASSASASAVRPRVAVTFDLIPWLTRDLAAEGPPPPMTKLELVTAILAVNRRVEALATALELSPDAEASDGGGIMPTGVGAGSGGGAARGGISAGIGAISAGADLTKGPRALSARLFAGETTRAICRDVGLVHVAASGARCRLHAVSRLTLLRDVGLSQEGWMRIVQQFAPSRPATGVSRDAIVAAAMTATRAEGRTVDDLCKALHHARYCAGDAFVLHADFFKVFQGWIYNLDSARARVDATKKHDAFKKMYNACLRDHRSKGLDIHNWLQRPNQHLMRQPLLLDALVASMHSEHPGFVPMQRGLDRIKVRRQ